MNPSGGQAKDTEATMAPAAIAEPISEPHNLPLAAADQVRLLRLLERTLGHGFKLAVVEVASPRDRAAVLAWLQPHIARLNGESVEVDLAAQLTSAVDSAPSRNLWDLLNQRIPGQCEELRRVLVLWGFEPLMYAGGRDGSELLQQINVQRDLFVRDFPCWWLLFIHPQSRQKWLAIAPDFCDFAATWIEAPTQRMPLEAVGAHALKGRSDTMRELFARDWPEPLRRAKQLVELSRFDEALDLLHGYRAIYGYGETTEREQAIIELIAAEALWKQGEPETALRSLDNRILPNFERLGDAHSGAVALGLMGDILAARGELDEALRMHQEKELPLYEQLCDEHSHAVTLGKVAGILTERGDLDRALRILRQDVLPAFERLGDEKSRAVALGLVADIMAVRGDLDEALRIRKEDELPVYERLGDEWSRAMTMGKVAEILAVRGDLEEALRIRQEEELPVYERLNDVHSRAIALGKVSEIFAACGDVDEALRIRQEEELPVYERLGDVRSRAMALGRGAEMLIARGDLDEALDILREDVLPALERLGDVRERAWTLGRVADILAARGDLEEALRIRRDEVQPIFERLGDVRSLIVGRTNLALMLQQRDAPGDREEAKQLLGLALEDARRMKLPEADLIQARLTNFG